MNLKTLFKGSGSSLQYGSRIRPVRDWLAVLAASAILFVASIAWNAWTYYQVTAGESFVAGPQPSSSPTLRSLEKARTVLTARAEEEDRYETFYQFVDPSR